MATHNNSFTINATCPTNSFIISDATNPAKHLSFSTTGLCNAQTQTLTNKTYTFYPQKTDSTLLKTNYRLKQLEKKIDTIERKLDLLLMKSGMEDEIDVISHSISYLREEVLSLVNNFCLLCHIKVTSKCDTCRDEGKDGCYLLMIKDGNSHFLAHNCCFNYFINGTYEIMTPLTNDFDIIGKYRIK